MGLSHFLQAVWSPDGMIWPYLNCWGLVRLARHELYGLPLLPGFGIPACDKANVTRAAHNVISSAFLKKVDEPEPSDIASAWCGGLCQHVGLVVENDGRLGVLEIGEKTGARWVPIAKWERLQSRVRYYR